MKIPELPGRNRTIPVNHRKTNDCPVTIECIMPTDGYNIPADVAGDLNMQKAPWELIKFATEPLSIIHTTKRLR